MNRFYFKNKDKPNKVCYEVYGKDAFTGIDYSLALCGTRKAAEKALEMYILRINPGSRHRDVRTEEYGFLYIRKTTIGGYHLSRSIEMDSRMQLRTAYISDMLGVNCNAGSIMEDINSCMRGGQWNSL